MTHDDDDSLFRDAMKSVEPLKVEKRVTLRAPRVENERITQKRVRASEADAPEMDNLSHSLAHKVGPNEPLLCAKPGLQQQQLKKLKLGQIPCEAAIDLHGYKVEEARMALVVFLRRCQNRGLKCVRIVHGKGLHRQEDDMTIKSSLVSWLQQLPSVMGYASCTPSDGGTGAVYVLLKRPKISPDKPD